MQSICFSALTAATLILTGCGTTAKFVYPDRMNNLIQVASAPAFPQKVAVTPFSDARNNDNQYATLFLYAVPAWPFGWVDYERPDAARGFVSIESFDFTPSEDLPKAAAFSLRQSNLFADAFFTFGGEKDRADLILEGKIISTTYHGRILSYGLSIAAPYIWLIGAPAGTSLNRLALHLTLKNKRGRIVWEYTFDRDDYITQWIYYRMGHDVRMYAKLMEQAMNEAITDMSSKLSANPNLLK